MAASTCPRCWGTSFEMVQHTPRNSGFTLMFVQCAHCGAVVGTMDIYNIGDLLRRQTQAIKRIGDQMGADTGL